MRTARATLQHLQHLQHLAVNAGDTVAVPVAVLDDVVADLASLATYEERVANALTFSRPWGRRMTSTQAAETMSVVMKPTTAPVPPAREKHLSEKVTAHFKMARAVFDDAETAAMAAASEHLHQLDSLRLEAAALSRENADLSIEVMQLRNQLANAGPADVVHLKEANGCPMAETMRLGALLERQTTERDNAVAELAHVREQLGAAMATIEKATTEAANAVVYANVDTSLSDPRKGKLLVVRVEEADAFDMLKNYSFTVMPSQWVGWLEAAQDEGTTATKAVDVHHAGAPVPVVRCGECTATVGHFGDCAKAVTP